MVWSSTNGATALCLHSLAFSGLLDLGAPVSEYWPQYSVGEKGETTVTMFLNHTAGLSAIREPVPTGSNYDWPSIIEVLENAELWWKPGTAQGYHALTQGFLCGEILRRIIGKTVGIFLQEEFAEPLGLDFFIGVPDDRLVDVAAMIFPEQEDPISDFFLNVESDPEGIQSKILTNDGGHMDEFQSKSALKSEIPAAGGVATAKALAKLFAPFACKGEINGMRFADNRQLQRMSSVSSASDLDRSLLLPMRFSEGFTKAMDNRQGKPGNQDSILMSENAVSCPGFGGSIGLADPSARLPSGIA